MGTVQDSIPEKIQDSQDGEDPQDEDPRSNFAMSKQAGLDMTASGFPMIPKHLYDNLPEKVQKWFQKEEQWQ